jgi:hypothetical protein
MDGIGESNNITNLSYVRDGGAGGGNRNSKGTGKTSNKNGELTLDYFSEKAGLNNGEGYSMYSEKNVNKEQTKYGTYVSCTTTTVYTFDDTREGDKITNAINDYQNEVVNNAQTYYSTGLGYLSGGTLGAILGAVADAIGVEGAFTNPDYSYGLAAGDTMIITSYGGSMVGSMSRSGLTTTVTVYDKYRNLKYSETLTIGH